MQVTVINSKLILNFMVTVMMYVLRCNGQKDVNEIIMIQNQNEMF